MATIPSDIDALLSDLNSLYGNRRKEAIFKLADLPASSRRVVEALLRVKNTDYRDDVREAAARALESPIHAEVVRQNPDLQGAASGQADSWGRTTYAALPWQDIWKLALKPSVENFERIISDPDATSGRAYKWVFFTFLVMYPIAIIISAAFTLMGRGRLNLLFQAIISGIPTLILYTLIYSVFAVVGLMLGGVVMHWGAKLLGGVGEYSKFVFAFAAITCPIAIVSLAVTSIPIVSLVGIPMYIYSFILQLTAIRATYKLGWGGSCLATIAIPLLILLIVACMIGVLPALFSR